MKIRTLIVEDEPLARRTLRDFIGEIDWLELVAEAEDGLEAVELIERFQPDLIFLDVQIPELSGLEVLDRISVRPAVVFTTAFDHYAVTAFELDALDYIQKPFGRDRFQATVERIRKHLEVRDTERKETDKEAPLKRLFVKKKEMIYPLDVDDIVWLQANGDYVNIYSETDKFLAGGTLTEFSRRLNPDSFLQVHRSSIVNLNRIEKIEELGRSLLIYMTNGSEVQASRAGSQNLKKLIA